MLQNIYLTISAIALLMFLDYWLTLHGQKLSKVVYSKHFVSAAYELNPILRDAIHNNRYSLKHLASVVLVAAGISLVYYIGVLLGSFRTYMVMQGLLIAMLLIVNARHLQNILIFRALNANPSILKGKIMLALEYSMAVSMYNFLSYVFLLGPMFLFVPSYFTFGCVLAPVVLFLKQKVRKGKRD